MVSGIPCLSFPALEVGIELVIIPSLVVIAFCVIIQGVWEHRAGRAAGWTLELQGWSSWLHPPHPSGFREGRSP